MMESHILDISHVIQLSVAPVFLLTALATMINAMNTRLGRIVDRRRLVMDRLVGNCDETRLIELEEELGLLYRRAHLAYLGVLFSVLSGLLVCLVMVGAFIGALISVELSKTIAIVFILSLCSMIVSLGMFLREVYLGVSSGAHVIH